LGEVTNNFKSQSSRLARLALFYWAKNMATKKKLPAVETIPSELQTGLPMEVVEASKDEIAKARESVGLTLETTLQCIKDAQKADKLVFDKTGAGIYEPDHDKRLKAALADLEIAGYIKAKGAVTDNSKHTHVTYAWLNAPNAGQSPNQRAVDVN
jgi:hypothetical protein